MTALSDHSIRKNVKIEPFVEKQTAFGMTYGLSQAGYDVRARIKDDKPLVLRPGEFALLVTMEHFEIPNDIVADVKDKSTLARIGLSLMNTRIEPGWRGYLTLEASNRSNKGSITIWNGMPIAQLCFWWTDYPCRPYDGKYQDQKADPQSAIFEADHE